MKLWGNHIMKLWGNHLILIVCGSFVALCGGVLLQLLKRRKRRLRLLLQKDQLSQLLHRQRMISDGLAKMCQNETSVVYDFNSLLSELRSGRLTASGALRQFQWRSLGCTFKTNAVTEFIVSAISLAEALDQLPAELRNPLHGLPFSVKECFFIPETESTGGYTKFMGMFAYEDDAPVVQWLKLSGGVPFAKSNVPQGMLTFDSRNEVYGTTLNPHNNRRSPGGSSSGEGVLVASGASFLGVGSDIGGSVRIPAAWCGCVALKPTSQRTLHGGTTGCKMKERVITADFLSIGFLSRDVATLVAIFRLLYSCKTFECFPQLKSLPFQETLFSLRPAMIGWYDCDSVCETVPGAKRAVKMAVDILEAAGHRLISWKPPLDWQAYILLVKALNFDCPPEVGMALSEDLAISLPNQPSIIRTDWPKLLQLTYLKFFGRSLGRLPCDVWRCLLSLKRESADKISKEIQEYRQLFDSQFRTNSLDAILCPAFACPALPLDSPRDATSAGSYPCIFNLINWPAGVVPVTKVTPQDEEQMADYPGDRDYYHRTIKAGLLTDSVKLPLCVQIAAPPNCEELILRLMSDIEAGAGYDNTPPI